MYISGSWDLFYMGHPVSITFTYTLERQNIYLHWYLYTSILLTRSESWKFHYVAERANNISDDLPLFPFFDKKARLKEIKFSTLHKTKSGTKTDITASFTFPGFNWILVFILFLSGRCAVKSFDISSDIFLERYVLGGRNS